MKLTYLLLAVASVIPLQAADPSGAIFWSATDMKAKDKVLATKMDETKSGMDKIIAMPNFNALNFHREGSGQSEVHEKFADFVIVRSGQGAILVGGKSRNAKPTTPGETRGEGVDGGARYDVRPGDVLYIPAGVPHQMIVEKGRELNAMVIKIEAK